MTNVHYPTDCNLLFDAMRKTITLLASACCKNKVKGWRQYNYQILQLKKAFRKTEKRKSSSADPDKKAKEEEKLKESVREYLEMSIELLDKARIFLTFLNGEGFLKEEEIEEIAMYMDDGARQINQIRRRKLLGETIPHEEKMFSIFERYTEWIVRGKAGVAFELGMRICIVEDQYGFILHHKVMERITDEKVAIEMVKKVLEKYPNFVSCSFDKGFHSPENQKILRELLKEVILPKKGKLSEEEKLETRTKEYKEGRRRHSRIEATINGLQEHGLKKCRDKGLKNFKKYAGLGILSKNLQRIGELEWKKEVEKLRKNQMSKLI